LLSVARAELAAGRAAVADGSEGQDAVELVGCGAPPAGHRLLVVDPESLEPLRERRVGEVLVGGPSVTCGYWRRDDLNASLWAHVGAERLLRTGDLGFLHAGELFVTGRRKDLIVLRGQNHYPQDLEHTAENAHAALLLSAAFVVGDPGDEERLVIAVQVDRAADGVEHESIARAVRAAVNESHGVDPASVVLLRQGSLPVTSSGKVQRSLCRDRYVAGELRVVFELARSSEIAPPTAIPTGGVAPRTAGEIEAWLGRWLAQRLEIDPTDVARDRPFAELGVDSLTAVELSGELEQELGVKLPPVTAWNHPTPAALAEHLAAQLAAAEQLAAESVAQPVTAPTSTASSVAASDHDLAAILAEVEALSEEEALRLLAE
ncbi:MAG: non-ribosomal peptide synthetase, partial [Lacipirellulaceae bacterium]